MEITWHGYSCFTIKTKEGVAVIDPYREEIGLKLPALKADTVLISHDHEGHNNVKGLSGEVRIIDWPGEYEVKGLAITAQTVPHGSEGNKKEPGQGLFFTIDADGMKICFLGDMGDKIDDALIESIGDVDVLMLPVGGHNTMNAKQAHNVIEEIEPRAIIPMHYATPGLKTELDDVEGFLKLVGASGIEAKDKFSLSSRSQLQEDKTEIILLKPQTA